MSRPERRRAEPRRPPRRERTCLDRIPPPTRNPILAGCPTAIGSPRLSHRDFLIASAGVLTVLPLAACGRTTGGTGGAGSSDAAATKAATTKAAPTHAIGDTVETDLVRFTLTRAQLAVALNNTLKATGISGGNPDFLLPKEYDAQQDQDNGYVAAVGSTLVSFDFTSECLDRQRLEIIPFTQKVDGKPNTPDYPLRVSYGDKSYGESGYTDSGYVEMTEKNGRLAIPNGTSESLSLTPGATQKFRGYVSVPFEPASLDDPFQLIIGLPTSSDKVEFFTYQA